MKHAGVISTLRSKYETLQPFLNERVQRLWSATEAMGLGHGGIAALAEATGMSRTTISHAIQEIQDQRESPGSTLPIQRSRRPGAGRKRLITQDPALLITLELLVDPTTRGDPMSPLRWTCKSTRKLAEQLRQYGYQISARTVALLLHQLNYSLQANRKTREGESHPDRNAQFEYINAQVAQFQKRNQPVVSVDTKKKELIGNFKNPGAEWQPEGSPELVNVYDFNADFRGPKYPDRRTFIRDLFLHQRAPGIEHVAAENRQFRSTPSPRKTWSWLRFSTADVGDFLRHYPRMNASVEVDDSSAGPVSSAASSGKQAVRRSHLETSWSMSMPN